MADFAMFSQLELRKRKSMSPCLKLEGNNRRNMRANARTSTSLKGLSKELKENGRHSMLSVLSSLHISVLRVLDTEA